MCLIEIVLRLFTVHQAVAASASAEDVETSEECTQGDYGHDNVLMMHVYSLACHGVAASILWYIV